MFLIIKKNIHIYFQKIIKKIIIFFIFYYYIKNEIFFYL